MMLPLLVFLGVLALVVAPYAVFVLGPESTEQRRLKRRLKGDEIQRQKVLKLVKEAERLSSVGVLNRLLLTSGRVVAPMQRLLDQSGLQWSVGKFVLAIGTAFMAGLFIVHLLSGSLLAGLIVGTLAAFVPFAYVSRARTKRLWTFEEQFPEGIDLIARALRAGHTFQAGLQMVADELPAPVGTEFRLLYDRQNFGMPIADALRSFADRVPLLDAKFFVTAVLTQRDAGGNLAEVLDNLSAVIRERFKVKRQVRVISAHGRITGWVLAGLPPALTLIFLLVSPNHMQTLFNDPLGVQLILVAIALQLLGTVVIRRIVNIEY